MSRSLGAVLVILLGIAVMVAALVLALFIPDPGIKEWVVLILMFIVGLGATVGGSEMR